MKLQLGVNNPIYGIYYFCVLYNNKGYSQGVYNLQSVSTTPWKGLTIKMTTETLELQVPSSSTVYGKTFMGDNFRSFCRLFTQL